MKEQRGEVREHQSAKIFPGGVRGQQRHEGRGKTTYFTALYFKRDQMFRERVGRLAFFKRQQKADFEPDRRILSGEDQLHIEPP